MSTLKVNSITDTGDNSLLGRRNLIINGDMRVAQRGTSWTNTTINTYNLDRWRNEGYQHDVDITQQSFTSGQTDVDGFPEKYVTVALNETINSGEYWAFQQRIEKPEMILEGAQTFTLSFWARATSGTVSSGTFSYGFGTGRESNPALTTTWQKITATYTYTVGSSGTYDALYLIHLGAGITAFSVDIANVQLEVGSVATPFEHRSYGEELARCQRYFCKGGTEALIDAYQGASGFNMVNYYFPVTMRTTPTLQNTNLTSSSNQYTGYPTVNADSSHDGGKDHFYVVSRANTTGRFYCKLEGWEADAEL